MFARKHFPPVPLASSLAAAFPSMTSLGTRRKETGDQITISNLLATIIVKLSAAPHHPRLAPGSTQELDVIAPTIAFNFRFGSRASKGATCFWRRVLYESQFRTIRLFL
ncbi:hypothetical protein ZHAS_00006844 [Anopheles sinensis]|uniref:Uncharacterized protein n=1 Tax=Anopheles sinensis TaxID=74873 RepID=A0A084VN63_ANOSI|nr:hypothetical protein ZHAS_00006844 [Anopheles sinensis]